MSTVSARGLIALDHGVFGERACAQFSGDVLLVESQNDEIIPHPAIANYIAAFANAHSMTYRVIEGADHALSQQAWQLAYTELLMSWMKEMTARALR